MELTTERLILRAWRESDVKTMQKIRPSDLYAAGARIQMKKKACLSFRMFLWHHNVMLFVIDRQTRQLVRSNLN